MKHTHAANNLFTGTILFGFHLAPLENTMLASDDWKSQEVWRHPFNSRDSEGLKACLAVVKAARRLWNHLVESQHQLPRRLSPLAAGYLFSEGGGRLNHSAAPRRHTFPASQSLAGPVGMRGQGRGFGEGSGGVVRGSRQCRLPSVEAHSRPPVAAAAPKCGWGRDLSSRRCGPASSSERKWCCSRSSTSTCSFSEQTATKITWKISERKKRNCTNSSQFLLLGSTDQGVHEFPAATVVAGMYPTWCQSTGTPSQASVRWEGGHHLDITSAAATRLNPEKLLLPSVVCSSSCPGGFFPLTWLPVPHFPLSLPASPFLPLSLLPPADRHTPIHRASPSDSAGDNPEATSAAAPSPTLTDWALLSRSPPPLCSEVAVLANTVAATVTNTQIDTQRHFSAQQHPDGAPPTCRRKCFRHVTLELLAGGGEGGSGWNYYKTSKPLCMH